MTIRNQNPKGGTELQLGFLHQYVDKNLLDQVQICTSVPGKVPIDPKKLKYTLAKKILTINLIYILGLKIKLTITNMIGMFLILIGIMKNLE